MSNVFPCLVYKDAPAAIAWLEKAFGFRTLMVVPGETPDQVVHSELALGEDIVMVYSTRDPDVMGMKSPRDLTGVNQSLYFVVDDVDGRFEKAKAAGADIVREPTD